MIRRFPVLLAVIAALLWAPSLTSAAGNSLASPSVSPGSGTVTTVFTLRVVYDGRFPASSVTVSVAGIALPMIRVSGTAAEGTWSVSTLLPAGTWTPTFTASALQGNAATIVGPAVSVAGPIADPTPIPTTSGPSPRMGDIDSGDPGAPPEPSDPGQPGTAPAESGTPSEPPAAPGPAASAPAGSASNGGSGSGAGAPSGPSASGGSTDGTEDGDPAAPASADAPPADASGDPAARPRSDEAPDPEPPVVLVDDSVVNGVLIVGLSGVAAVAVIGAGLLLLGRRRRSEAEEAPGATPGIGDTEALLERRTLRQAKVRLSDDPITAAMGVDDQVAARRQRRRATQVGSGPGERPTQPRRPRPEA